MKWSYWRPWAAMAALCTATAVDAGPLDVRKGFEQADKEGQPVTMRLRLAKGISLSATLETTGQGNGTLTLGNLSLRLLDRHDDGLLYRDGVLKLETVLLGTAQSRVPGFVVSGIIARTGEKESDPVQEEALVAIYQLDCKSGRFRRVYFTGNAELEMDGPKHARIQCPAK